MIFGRSTCWRLLSPFGALLCVLFMAGMAGPAVADSSSDHRAAAGAAASSSASEHPSPQAADPASSSNHADKTVRSAASHSTSGNAGTSGDVHSPQPLSKADLKTGGANGQCPGGPYCSTRDGSASANGNGGGQAAGKPCAGCVGKADNKNPKGQMPNASDHNAGYECDTNHGIARGNPAHTKCVSSQPECVVTPTNACTPPCVVTEANTCTPPCVVTSTNTCLSSPVSSVVEAPTLGSAAAAAAGSALPTGTSPAKALPSTGASEGLVGQAAIAILTILAGAALVATRRRPGQQL